MWRKDYIVTELYVPHAVIKNLTTSVYINYYSYNIIILHAKTIIVATYIT